MKVLQINSVLNTGSTGRIVEEIGNVLIENGHESYIAYSRGNPVSKSKVIKIGSNIDLYLHGAYTLLTDKHGLGIASKQATIALVNKIKSIKPDVISFNSAHGYYLNLPILFNFFKESDIPVVWTLFGCWAFTGHCSYFDDINCIKWQTHCEKCPKHKNYPSSWVDNSFDNFESKQKLFTSVKKMELITHSDWLSGLVKESFLRHYRVHVTPSAINLDLFKPLDSNLRNRYKSGQKKIILGCASTWSNRKGLNDFVDLSKQLTNDYQIVLIGLSQKQISTLPNNVIGIQRTESIKELAQWYTLAQVFVNPTKQDNFPTTNLEALACGTPVITYDTGGSPEAIDDKTGIIVRKGDVKGIVEAIIRLEEMDTDRLSKDCIGRAENLFDKKKRYLDYLNIFKNIAYNG